MAGKPRRRTFARNALATALGFVLNVVACVWAPVFAQTNSQEVVRNMALVRANLGGESVTAQSNQAMTNVDVIAEVEVTPGTTGYVVPGATHVYSHKITNAGNATDTYHVEVSDELNWLLNLGTLGTILKPRLAATSLEVGPLAPGQRATLQLQVTAPVNAPLGSRNIVSLQVASLRVPGEQEIVSDTTVVTDPTFEPCRLSVDPVGSVVPGELLRYRLEFGNNDPNRSISDVLFEDVLDSYLVSIEGVTSGTVDDAAVPGRSIEVVHEYDNHSNTMRWRIDSLPPGFRGSLELMVRTSPQTPDGQLIRNEIRLSGSGVATKVTNNVEIVVIRPLLNVEILTMTPEIDPGDPVLYRVRVFNLSESNDLNEVEMQLSLPQGFRFLETSPNTLNKPYSGHSVSGRSGVYRVPQLSPGDSHEWTLKCATSERIRQGNHFAQVTAHGTAFTQVNVSASAETPVRVRRDLRWDGIIVGRVYVDSDDDMHPDIHEGLPNVRVLLEDGTSARTDARGRFHLEGVRPGTRVLRIDRSNLPSSLEFETEGRLAAGSDRTRFVDVHPGELRKINFRATSKAVQHTPRYEIAFGQDVYRFYVFSLFDPGRATLLPEARRMLLDIASGSVGSKTASANHGEEPQLSATSLGSSAIPNLPSVPGRKTPIGEIRLRRLPETSIATTLQSEETQKLGKLLGLEMVREATAPKLPEVDLETRIESTPQAVAILSPRDGEAASKDRIRVLVKFPSKSQPKLRVNDRWVGDELIGKRHQLTNRGVSAYEYVGVPLRPGENTLWLEACSDSLNCQRHMVTVWLAGEPNHIQISLPVAAADGRMEPEVRIELRDAAGRLVRQAGFVTVDVEGGIIESDADPRREGIQVPVRNGAALIHLPPSQVASERRIRAYFADLSDEKRLHYEPAPGDWLLTGGGEIGVAGRPNGEPLTADQIEEGMDLRGGLFAQGPIGTRSQLTLRYDAQRQREEFFGALDREEGYPALGDATQSHTLAPSQWKLFARLDAPEGHAQIGDFNTGWTDLEFARFDRTLTGFDGTWYGDDGESHVHGFAASSRQGAAHDEFPGTGTSGPFTLSQRPIIVDSERIHIETRHRIHTERVVESRPLTRFADYTINYLNGTILLKAPLASADSDFNPNYLVAQYETIEQTDEKPLVGLRGQAKLGKVTTGLTAVNEETAAGNHLLLGVHSTIPVRQDLELDMEFAQARAFETGNAYQVSLQGRAGPSERTRVYYREIDEEFSNDSRTGRSQLGTRKYGVEAEIKAATRGRVVFDGYMQSDKSRDLEAYGLVTDYHTSVGAWKASVGHRLTGEGHGNKQSANLASMTLGRKFGDRINLETGFQKAFGDAISNHPTRLSMGLDARLTQGLSARLRQEWDGSNTGRQATLFSLESQVDDHTAITSRLENVRGDYASRATAFAGLRTGVSVHPDWSLSLSAEQGRVFEGSGSRASALSLGLQYERALDLASLQWEARWTGATFEQSVRAATASRVSDSWSLIGREHWRRVRSNDVIQTSNDLLLGLALRSPWNDAFQSLLSLRVITAGHAIDLPGVATSRTLASLESSLELSRRHELVGGYALRFAHVRAQDENAEAFSGLSHLRWIYALRRRWDLSTGLRHRRRTHSQNDWSYGTELGFNALEDLWIVGGYNFVGFADLDFPTTLHTGRSAYLTIRFKFDERFFGALER